MLSDSLDEFAQKKVARFLTMLSIASAITDSGVDKSYRFQLHHKFLAPEPQLFPFGYSADLVKKAREILEASSPSVTLNEVRFTFPKEMKDEAEAFLKDVDGHFTQIASFVRVLLVLQFSV